MKYLIICFAALTLISCKELEVNTFEYTTSTMMGKTQMIVTQDSVTVDFNGRGEPTHFARATKSEEWSGLMLSLQEVDLDKIADLEAPSDMRSTDASPFAYFIFATKDSSYRSATFDHKNPNSMLMPTMEKILEIQEENKK